MAREFSSTYTVVHSLSRFAEKTLPPRRTRNLLAAILNSTREGRKSERALVRAVPRIVTVYYNIITYPESGTARRAMLGPDRQPFSRAEQILSHELAALAPSSHRSHARTLLSPSLSHSFIFLPLFYAGPGAHVSSLSPPRRRASREPRVRSCRKREKESEFFSESSEIQLGERSSAEVRLN